jgi:hypothetical protein
MTTLSTPHAANGAAAPDDDARDAPRPTQPEQPAPHPTPSPRAEPAPPTDKPLPDLPNPAEVGEDG